MPWSDNDFRNAPSWTEDKAERMIEARHIMGSCLLALQYGTLEWHPAPGTKYDPTYVRQAVAQIDRRWNTEWRTRGRNAYAMSANFGERLTTEQQMALVQRLRHALNKG
ncbi:MAG: hypothetical protein WD645_01275, partial [Dehalococcoidia bacterium]